MQRLKDKRFALLGVNTDDDAYYRKGAAKEPTVWPNWRDGSGGLIATHWAINGFPTIYILDAKGVIRFCEQVDEKAMDAEIDQLLAEMDQASPAPTVAP